MVGESAPRANVLLVVEDNVGVRSLVSLLLNSAGYLVREAASGEEAIDIARGEQPLLVLLDIRLPGISGYEVCCWLRERLRGSVPVMCLSGERAEPSALAAVVLLGAAYSL